MSGAIAALVAPIAGEDALTGTLVGPVSSGPLLDVFNVADGALATTNWDLNHSFDSSVAPTTVSGQIPSLTGGTGAAWKTPTGSADHECYFTIGTVPAPAAATVFSWIQVFVRGSGVRSTWNSYIMALSRETNGTSTWYFHRSTASSTGASLGSVGGTQRIQPGDGVGCSIAGNTLSAWHRRGRLGAWLLVGSLVDTGLAVGDKIGFNILAVSTLSTVIDDFGGGALVPAPMLTVPTFQGAY